MPRRILVVDDEMDTQDLILQKFRKKIDRKEWAFDFACNGKEALDKLANDESFEVVLLDINMPVMDGLTFMNEAKKMNRPLQQTIIITAHEDMTNIRTAMNHGAFDFLTKPLDMADMEVTLNRILKELAFRKDAIEHQNEVAVTAEIQTSMLPNTFPTLTEGNDPYIHARLIQAKKVGGDFYDSFYITRHRIGIVVADVEGKGIPAAIFMASCIAVLRSIALREKHTDACLEAFNNHLCKNYPGQRSVTVFYGALDLRDGSFEYCCGGHSAPYLVPTDGNVTQLGNIGGLVPGYIEGSEYESKKMTLEPGDTIFVYTDGVTDALNQEDHRFGEEHLIRHLQNIQKLPVDAITQRVVEAVEAFSRGVKQEDDITCLAIKYREK